MTDEQEKQLKDIEPVLQSAARINFWAFCCWMDWDFFRIRRRFFKDIALTLQWVADEYEQGRARTVSISMPPRAGKSYISSLFAAYWLGRFPTTSVMRNTCTATLYDKFSYDTRAIVTSERYRQVFDVELSKDKRNINGWNLTTAKQVSYFGAGVGGSIIGFGANLALTDDLYTSMSDALSEATNNGVKMWKQSAHNSRMEKNCPEIFIGTRWTRNDIIGEALESGRMDRIVSIPALIEQDGQMVSFCDDVKSTHEYELTRESLMVGDHDGTVWLAEYMQTPTDARNTLLPIDKIQFADISALDYSNFSYTFCVGDPADTGGDKYACPFLGVTVQDVERNGHKSKDVRVYVLGALCNNDGIVANTMQILDRRKRFKSEHVFIEKNGVGLASYIELAKYLDASVLKPFTSSENKDVRIQSNYEFVLSRFVFDTKYKEDRQYQQFMNDLTGYTKEGTNTHKKDAIDTLCTAAQVVKIKYKEILYL